MCAYVCTFLFVELKVVGSFGSTEASAREFLEIEGGWVFGIDGSKCMCACVCVSLCVILVCEIEGNWVVGRGKQVSVCAILRKLGVLDRWKQVWVCAISGKWKVMEFWIDGSKRVVCVCV